MPSRALIHINQCRELINIQLSNRVSLMSCPAKRRAGAQAVSENQIGFGSGSNLRSPTFGLRGSHAFGDPESGIGENGG
jgi:hypothetical protein